MKNLKKVIALVLVAIMVLAMGTAISFAASITLTSEPATYQDNHTYNVYQIFNGTVVSKTVDNQTVKELQNVKYGANYGNTGASVPKADLDAITDARALAASLVNADPAVLNGTIATLTKANGFKAENLAPGYYLIVDTVTGTLAEGDVFSQYIVQVLDNVTMDTKKDVPSSDKTITAD